MLMKFSNTLRATRRLIQSNKKYKYSKTSHHLAGWKIPALKIHPATDHRACMLR